MDQKLSKVYLVRLKTSGEIYESFVCACFEAALAILTERRITKREHEGVFGFWDYTNPTDSTQTAVIIRKELVY